MTMLVNPGVTLLLTDTLDGLPPISVPFGKSSLVPVPVHPHLNALSSLSRLVPS